MPMHRSVGKHVEYIYIYYICMYACVCAFRSVRWTIVRDVSLAFNRFVRVALPWVLARSGAAMRNGVKCKRVKCNKFATCPNVCTVHHETRRRSSLWRSRRRSSGGSRAPSCRSRSWNKCKEFQCWQCSGHVKMSPTLSPCVCVPLRTGIRICVSVYLLYLCWR